MLSNKDLNLVLSLGKLLPPSGMGELLHNCGPEGTALFFPGQIVAIPCHQGGDKARMSGFMPCPELGTAAVVLRSWFRASLLLGHLGLLFAGPDLKGVHCIGIASFK
eukprot:g27718.t1